MWHPEVGQRRNPKEKSRGEKERDQIQRRDPPASGAARGSDTITQDQEEGRRQDEQEYDEQRGEERDKRHDSILYHVDQSRYRSCAREPQKR
jgi:hypothetical protein